MGRYILRRLLLAVPMMVMVTVVTFTIANVIPGSPVSQLARQMDPRIRPEDLERIKRSLGLDQPLHVRYFVWVSHAARGDFGLSMRSYTPVDQLILERLPNTLLLTGSALALSLLIAVPVGVASAVRRGSVFDSLATAAAVGGYSVPAFWLGLILILLFAIKFREWGLPALPAGGAYDLRGGGDAWDRLQHLILPAVTLSLVQTAYWTRFVRSQMLEVLSQDYVRTAVSKGLAHSVVVYRHALRNTLVPLVTLLGLTIPELFGGALLIEQIFNWPGLGRLAYRAALDKDYPVIMGTVLVAAVLVIVGNLLADVLYGIVDPRLRAAQT